MNLENLLPKEWHEFLELPLGYFETLNVALQNEVLNPNLENIFATFAIMPSQVKVVILGQDPYPNVQDAMGLSFSIPKNSQRIPGSLRNIRKELETDLQIQMEELKDLTPWLDQGVMLLNQILTTRPGESLAHKKIGWEDFTKRVVQRLAQNGAIFILWGKSAQEFSFYIPEDQVISGVHPSPLSANRGFFGSKPFSNCNNKLIARGLAPINWKS